MLTGIDLLKPVWQTPGFYHLHLLKHIPVCHCLCLFFKCQCAIVCVHMCLHTRGLVLAVQNVNWECVFGTNAPLSLGCLCIVATDTYEEDPRVERIVYC